MHARLSTTLRWAALPPTALLAALLMQVVIFFGALLLLQSGFGVEPSWIRWTAKCIATPFMGAAFVGVAWWLAPASKRWAALLCLSIVVVWSGVLLWGAFQGGFHPWLLSMGVLGLSGGLVAYGVGQWRLPS